MTAYANQKALLLNRLVTSRTYAGGTKYVATTGNDTTGDGTSGAPYLTVSKALSVITDAAANKRYRVYLADGEYTITDSIDIRVGVKPYIDIVGSGPRSGATGVKITCSTSAKDCMLMGGGNNMIAGLYLEAAQAGGDTGAYAVHGDSSGASLSVIHNCILTATKKQALGLAARTDQRWFVVDCTNIESTLASYHGMYTRPEFGEGPGRLAAIGCSFKGPQRGVQLLGYGGIGVNQFLFSGCTFNATGTGSGWGDADFGISGNMVISGTGQQIPKKADGTDSGLLWPTAAEVAAGATQYTFQGFYRYHPWWIRDYGAYDAVRSVWTMYYSNVAVGAVPAGWILFPTDSVALGRDLEGIQASRGATTDYFYLPGEGGLNAKVPLPMVGNGTNFAALTPPRLYTGAITQYIGVGDEAVVFFDQGGGANTFTNNGSQTTLNSIKSLCYINSNRIHNCYNGLQMALSWLDQYSGGDFDPSYPAAADVRAGTAIGDGTTGTMSAGGRGRRAVAAI